MWITVEILNKREGINEFFIEVAYSTDDNPPRTFSETITLSTGQDESTLMAAISQRLTALNAKDTYKATPEYAALKSAVTAIRTGPVDLKAVPAPVPIVEADPIAEAKA